MASYTDCIRGGARQDGDRSGSAHASQNESGSLDCRKISTFLMPVVVFVASGTHMTSSSQKPLLAEFDYDHVSELLVPTTVQGLKNLASVATLKRVYRLPKFVWRDVLEPGIYALGAAAAKSKGDQQRLDRYLGLFNAIAEQSVLPVGPGEGGLGMPYELMYGRAGFLWAVLFVNKYVGEGSIPWSVTGPVVDAVLAAGRARASHTQCPLMYQWHGSRYWGAAHGLAGIITSRKFRHEINRNVTRNCWSVLLILTYYPGQFFVIILLIWTFWI